MTALLTLEDVDAFYGAAHILHRLSLHVAAGERVAFTLMVFTEGRASYISTAPREFSVAEIKNLLTLWGHDMPDVPAHEIT